MSLSKTGTVRKNADKSNTWKWIPERYPHAFKNALDKYEAEHPHWRIEVLVSLIKWAIRNLKRSIEEEPNGDVTWGNPLVEFHYPVDWDWKSPHDGDMVYGKQHLGKFTKENTSDPRTAAGTLAQMMACRFNTMALGDLTNGAWFEKRDNAYIPYLPPELDAEIKQIKGKWKRREALEEIYKPFWIGTTRIDIPGSGSKTNAGVPRRVAKRLESIRQQMDIAGISFTGDVNGRKMWCGLIFEIQPLIIDYDAEKAYYAVTIGLAFEHKLVGNDAISITPSDWPRKDQEAFWDEILQGVDKCKERLIPANEIISSIILVDNNEILEAQPLHGPNDIKVAKKLLAGFQTERQKTEALARQGKRMLYLLQACDVAETPDEKGRSLEDLVAELFDTVPGLNVVDRRRRTQTEEIDLVISHDGNVQGFKGEAELILAECKNWSKKCGGNEFVLFKEKINNRKGRSSLGFLISWNGFADTIPKEMLRLSHERVLIVPLNGDQIRTAVQRGTFHSLLTSAKHDATLV
jgi:hypothetical protein